MAAIDDIAARIGESPVFATMTAEARAFLASRLEPMIVPAGQTLIRRGEPADALYLITVGRLRVTMELTDGSEVTVNELGRGEVVGEMALMTQEPRSADVAAVRDSNLLRLPIDAYFELVSRYPEAQRQITTHLLRRLIKVPREGNRNSPVVNIVVVPLHARPAVQAFGARLFSSFTEMGRAARHATRGSAAEEIGSIDRVSSDRLAAWFAAREAAADVVVYDADPDADTDAWLHACIRQADLVVLVADATGSTQLRPIEAQVAAIRGRVPCRMCLVLVHPPETTDPTGSRRWLEARPVEIHHHVREDRDDDVDRVARLQSGRGVGVVFSGGGARGFAEVGVVRALHETRVPIDVVGGSSMGAIVGALVARGRTVEEIVATLWTDIVKTSPFDVTAPVVALTAGRRVTEQIRGRCDQLDVEDLWRSFFCVSTNLTRARPEVHRTGPLWLALRASVSIPGLFPPVQRANGDLLVDGGVIDNLPTSTLRRIHEGVRVIAVDVGRSPDMSTKGLPEGGVASGWKLLLDRLDPRMDAARASGLVRILMRLTELGGAGADLDRGDLYIRPPVEPFGITDFKSFRGLIDLGYEAAMRALEEAGST